MGYLLPIQYFQYQDYQNRIKPVRTNDRQTARVDRVRRVYLSQNKNLNMKPQIISSQQAEKNNEKVYAELTGVGTRFDVRI